MLIVLTGLPATGKTTIARLLAERMRAVHVRIDSVEQAIRGARPGMDVGELGYLVAFKVAADNLRVGLTVIADGVNDLQMTRDAWRTVADQAGCGCVTVEVVCSDAAEHQARARGRVVDVEGLVAPTWEAIVSRRFEPVVGERVVVDTAVLSAADAVEAIVDASARRHGSTGFPPSRE